MTVDWPAMLPDVARRLLADRPCRELGGDKANGAGKVGADPGGMTP